MHDAMGRTDEHRNSIHTWICIWSQIPAVLCTHHLKHHHLIESISKEEEDPHIVIVYLHVYSGPILIPLKWHFFDTQLLGLSVWKY